MKAMRRLFFSFLSVLILIQLTAHIGGEVNLSFLHTFEIDLNYSKIVFKFDRAWSFTKSVHLFVIVLIGMTAVFVLAVNCVKVKEI